MSNTQDKNLTPNQIAIELGISVRLVLAEIRRRRIFPVIRISRKTVLVPSPVYEAYKKARMS